MRRLAWKWAIASFLVLVISSSVAAQADDEALIALFEAGVCEDFEQTPLACQSVLVGSWSQVWTAPEYGLTQEYWTAELYGPVLSTETEYVAYLDLLSSLPYGGCAEAYATLMCPTFFRPCIASNSSELSSNITVLPVPVCRSKCLAANDACRDYYGGDLLPCDSVDPLTGQAQWPEDSDECTTDPGVPFPKLEYSCPTPLLFSPDVPDQLSGLGCSSTCDQKLYMINGSAEYHRLYIIISVCAWISFVLMTFQFITFMIFPELRKFPVRIVLFLTIGLWFLSLGPVGATFIGIGYGCKNDTEVQYGISYCSFYAWSTYFGALFGCVWWSFQAFVIFYNLVLQGHRGSQIDKRLELPMIIFSWTYCLAASIILSTVPIDALGTEGTMPWCSTSLVEPVYHSDMEYGLFYAVLILSALLTSIFIVSSIIYLIRKGLNSSMKKKSLFRFFFVMALFCISFLIAIISVLAIRFQFQVQSAEWDAGPTDWYSCVLSWRISTSDCPIAKIDINFLRWVAFMYNTCGAALFVCFFLLREKTWSCWTTALTNVYHGRSFYDNQQVTSTGRTPRTSKRSSESGSH